MFKCRIKGCKAEFNRRDNLKRHYLSIHEMPVAEVEKLLPPVVPVIVARSVEESEEDAAELLSKKGYSVSKPTQFQDRKYTGLIKPYQGRTYRIGVVADTQLGSRFQQLTHLYTFYRLCQERGITQVVHSGDLVDGQKMYKGHEFELFLHGADAQVDYTIQQYPKLEGMETLVIGGNHDDSHWKHAGMNVCKAIAKERPDIQYLGMYGAYFEIGGISVYLYHAGGGVAYARSYRLQRFIEQLSPQQKPHILLMGHFHCQDFLPMYRNVVAIQLPCFQSQTPYLKQKGLYPEIGGLILEFTLDETVEPIGLASFKPEFIPFYRPVDDDF